MALSLGYPEAAVEAARAGEAAGLVVVADHQTAGRGRLGRTWEAPSGASLLVSVLLRPDLRPDAVHLLTMAAGLAMADAVEAVAGTPGVAVATPEIERRTFLASGPNGPGAAVAVLGIDPATCDRVAREAVSTAERERLRQIEETAEHIVVLAGPISYLLATDSFAGARLDTALITREQAVLFADSLVTPERALAAAVAQVYLADVETTAQQGWVDPFARVDGFQPFGPNQRRWLWRVGENTVVTTLTTGTHATLAVADRPAQAWSATRSGDDLDIVWGTQRFKAQVHVWGEQAHVFLPEGARVVERVDELAHAGDSGEAGGQLTAPMPGKVLSFAVKVGDDVKAGQAVAVMEAMKMEHHLQAPRDGTVSEVTVREGMQVAKGKVLVRLLSIE